MDKRWIFETYLLIVDSCLLIATLKIDWMNFKELSSLFDDKFLLYWFEDLKMMIRSSAELKKINKNSSFLSHYDLIYACT